MELEGKLFIKTETKFVSDKFSKREFIVEYSENPQYPQFIKFELTQDKCPMLDVYNVGDNLKIYFNIRGNEWKGNYYVNLVAWKIELIEKAEVAVTTNNPLPTDIPF